MKLVDWHAREIEKHGGEFRLRHKVNKFEYLGDGEYPGFLRTAKNVEHTVDFTVACLSSR